MSKETEKEATDLEKLTELLEDTLTIFREDRALAQENYNEMRAQLQVALRESDFEGQTTSDLETNVNRALELVFKSSDKLLKVTETLSKIIVTNLNNENKLQIADKLVTGPNGEKLISNPVDIQDIQKRLSKG